MDRSGLTRGTRWCQACSPSVSNFRSYSGKKNITKNDIFSLVTSRTYSISLTTDLRAQIDSGDPGLSFGCYITVPLASIVIEIIAIFCENSPILRKFDLFLTPCDLKFDLIKN